MIHYIENDYLRIGVKEFGAELTSVISKATNIEYLWQDNPDVWSGQSPILFPIIGRLIDDKYYLEGKEYSMPKHGFFRKREAKLFEKTATSLTFVQSDGEDTISNYPYKFDLFVKFELIDKSLKVTHTLCNKNDKVMYFSIGGHPAFNIKIGDYILFSENETLDTEAIDAQSLRVDDKIPVLNNERKIIVTEDIFNNDALIFSNMKSKSLTISSDDHNRVINFDFNNAPYLGIWAKPSAPYVCIEPWWGVNDNHIKRDDISKKDAIESVAANSDFSCYWSATILE